MATTKKTKSSSAKPRKQAARKAGTRKMPVTLYGHWLSHPSLRMALMLRLTHTPYAYRHIDLLTEKNLKPAYRKINRYGQVPTLIYRNKTLCQSSRMLELLAERTGKFDARAAADKQLVREWLNWCDDRLAGVTRARSSVRFAKGKPDAVAYLKGHAKLALDAFDAHLKGRDFIVGKALTIADIAAWPAVAHAGEAKFDLRKWPNALAWCERMTERSGVADPYDLLPKSSRLIEF